MRHEVGHRIPCAQLQVRNAQLQKALAEGDTDAIVQQCDSADASRSSAAEALQAALATSEARRKELASVPRLVANAALRKGD